MFIDSDYGIGLVSGTTIPTVLYHVSEVSGICTFKPRVPPSSDSGITYAVVWAVDDSLLHNYLLPRDCPRVTFYATENSDERDLRMLLGPSARTTRAVVAIESRWLPRVRATSVYLYRMPPDEFEIADETAGYWVSTQTVSPLDVTEVRDCIGAIVERNVELRCVPSLWPLHDAVMHSSLSFSCIRMRNARSP